MKLGMHMAISDMGGAYPLSKYPSHVFRYTWDFAEFSVHEVKARTGLNTCDTRDTRDSARAMPS